MDDRQIQQTIERYLEGSMNKDEIAEFEASLQQDDDLRNELEMEKAARSVIAEAGREQMRVQLDAFEADWQMTQKNPNHIQRKRFQKLAFAAAILLVIAALLWWLPTTPAAAPDLFAKNFEVYRTPPTERGNAENTAWEKAVLAYSNADYQAAAMLFEESLKDTSSLSYLSHFYLGVSQLSQQPPQATAALTAFEAVLLTDNDYRQQALWYQALALLQLDRKTEALASLRILIDTGDYKKEEAQKLISLLSAHAK